MADLLRGAILMAYFVTGLFFLKFWKASRDRLFLFFAIAFWILASNQILGFNTRIVDEELPVYFVVRLFAFLIILVAIVDKNYLTPMKLRKENSRLDRGAISRKS